MFRTLMMLTAVAAVTGTGAAKEPKPLFQSEAPIEMTVTGPLRSIARSMARSTDPHAGTLTVGGESHPIELSARGVSRRQSGSCTFPPLRVAFTQKPGDESLFKGQKRLKLVNHCKDSGTFEQLTLKEYLAYRLHEIITDESFNVRLTRTTFVDAPSGDAMTTRYAFFVEDADDVAKRLGLKELDVKDITTAHLRPDAAGRFPLFQYMLSNVDWAMEDVRDGEDCCHNTKILAADPAAIADVLPVPYDFDASGVVDAPYALQPAGRRGKKVTIRTWRGLCQFNDQTRAAVPHFRAKEGEILAMVDEVPGLADRNRTTAKKFLGKFFDEIRTDAGVEKLLDDCRNYSTGA